MEREPGTTANGKTFEKRLTKKVWDKCDRVKGKNPVLWRQDVCGTLINWAAYGNRNSQYGWEVDHIKPVSKGGSDDLDNLQALHWENNQSKADTYPWDG